MVYLLAMTQSSKSMPGTMKRQCVSPRYGVSIINKEDEAYWTLGTNQKDFVSILSYLLYEKAVGMKEEEEKERRGEGRRKRGKVREESYISKSSLEVHNWEYIYIQIYLLEWIIICTLAHPTMSISQYKVKNWIFVQYMRLDTSASL